MRLKPIYEFDLHCVLKSLLEITALSLHLKWLRSLKLENQPKESVGDLLMLQKRSTQPAVLSFAERNLNIFSLLFFCFDFRVVQSSLASDSKQN